MTCTGNLRTQLAAFWALFTPLSAQSYHEWCTTWFNPAQMNAGMASPSSDPDADGCCNIAEYLANSSPLDDSTHLSWELAVGALSGVTATYHLSTTATDASAACEVSNDLLTWWQHGLLLHAVPSPCYGLNGYHYVRLRIQPSPGVFIDTDGDGLEDFFEETLIAASTTDPYTSLADILPGEDFDSDGTLNIDEAANAPARSGLHKPPLLAPPSVSTAINTSTPAAPDALLVHTPLQ